MNNRNFFSAIQKEIPDEIVETIIQSETVRIERIISKGHTSPENFWYNQDENEWVIVLEGKGIIKLEDETIITLQKGDYLNIPAYQKHRVEWTDPNQLTIWLAVFYK